MLDLQLLLIVFVIADPEPGAPAGPQQYRRVWSAGGDAQDVLAPGGVAAQALGHRGFKRCSQCESAQFLVLL